MQPQGCRCGWPGGQAWFPWATWLAHTEKPVPKAGGGGEEELKQEEQEPEGSQREEGLGESGPEEGGGVARGGGGAPALSSHPAWGLTVSLSPEAGRVL